MRTFQLNILAADRSFYTGPCESLIIPTPQGKYGILAHHSNMIIAIVPGTLSYTLSGQDTEIAAVSHGIAKIEHNNVFIFVDSAERPQEIDINRAKRAISTAKEAILHKKSVREYHFAQARLARAIARLTVKDNYDSLRNRTDY